MRLFLKIIVLTIGLEFLIIIFFGIFSNYSFQKKYIYPFYYKEIIYQYSLNNKIDPFLVTSVINTESKFKSNALSAKGAIGLMQLMPETASWIATQLQISGFSNEMLKIPEINIKLGVWYLNSLKNEFNSNEILMLAAYNGGRGNVIHWMEQYGWTMSFNEIDQIPFQETKNYVKKVLYNKENYENLYRKL